MKHLLYLLLLPILCAYTPVITPNGSSLPFTIAQDGAKEFHLIAQRVDQEFAPGLIAHCWGYNGSTPGPTIEAVEGDHVRIYVTNQLPEVTSVHWHGLLIPNGMDGVKGLTQPGIPPGETFLYEFTLKQSGTYMYHSHTDETIQQAMGLMGFFIIHPKHEEPHVDRDYAIFLQEWALTPGACTPDPTVMLDFNYFTFNGKIFPATDALLAQKGERVRLRFANLTMDNHPIHIHGYAFTVTANGGWRLPPAAQYQEGTVDVPVGTTRDVEFIADVSGDWALHCHKSHHTMNGMAHGLPNLLDIELKGVVQKLQKILPGVHIMGTHGMEHMSQMYENHPLPLPPNYFPPIGEPGQFGWINMGGMFTVVKVRNKLPPSGTDPGWYHNPPGTVAHPVSPPPSNY